MTLSSDNWNLEFSNLIFPVNAILLYVGLRAGGWTHRHIWLHCGWFLISIGVQTAFSSALWHLCYMGAYCSQMNQDFALALDVLSSLMSILASVSLWFRTPVYNALLLQSALTLCVIFISVIPDFTWGTNGALIWCVVVLAWFLLLTYKYVVRTSWFLSVWIGVAVFLGLMGYFRYTEYDNYAMRHPWTHYFEGLAALSMILGMVVLQGRGELDVDMSDEVEQLKEKERMLRETYALLQYFPGQGTHSE